MKWKTISLTDKEGLELFLRPLQRTSHSERFYPKKSMELFHEPEPCIIYRTQITRKFYLELLEKFPGKPKSGMILSLSDCPELTSHIDLSAAGRQYLVSCNTYRTTFSRCQISLAYSSMVRSDENLPHLAV